MTAKGTSGLTDRRSFLAMAGAAWTTSLSPRAAFALSRTEAVFAAAFMAPDGGYGIATVAEEGAIISRERLPARAHGLAFSAATGDIVAFARRPGTFAMILDRTRRRAPIVITAAEGRHFFGHGCFSADGRLLYATENDFSEGRGMVGVYDATDAYARIGEFASHGIGPHDMTLMEGGRLLAIANGGISTHPDFGRTKLNLDSMEPSLSLVDTRTGALVETHGLPPELRQLSTRHLDLDADGRLWFACQYEGARNDLPPLVGTLRRGEAPAFVTLPDPVTESLANYVGAIAINRAENHVGLTSPKGGALVVLDAASGRVLQTRALKDAAGIAPAPHGLAASSYDGRFGGTLSPVAWDQHIVRLG
ncbi:DUF1513 domain-containing protein [Ensifer soli]|uniref:DUF1513 domain-containing protein n=1 Tax=Ciceribacter sp. sgz301302 TaxID=3342379 RepID=UPI0035BA5872